MNLGGCIHHEFTRNGFAKEAFGHVFDYSLVGGLNLKELFVKTRKDNVPFRALMKSLGLGKLEKLEWLLDENSDLKKEWITYTFGKKEWMQAKRDGN